MKKWKVRYEVKGFVVNEVFETKRQANKFLDKVLTDLGTYLLDYDMWEI